MSRQIDPNSIETAEDVRYLNDRPWLIEELERQGFTDQMAAVRDGQTVRRSPEEESKITTDQMRVGTQVPQQIDPRGNGVTGDPDGDQVDDNYEEWTVEELKAEIDERNKEDRETPLSKDGKKADLATRLHEDDLAQGLV